MKVVVEDVSTGGLFRPLTTLIVPPTSDVRGLTEPQNVGQDRH